MRIDQLGESVPSVSFARATRLWRHRPPVQWYTLVLAVIVPLGVVGTFEATRERPRVASEVIQRAAKVSVQTDPPGAELLIDGEPLGQTPLSISIAPGRYVMTVRHDADERSVPLEVAAGAQVSHHLDLNRREQPTATTGQLVVMTDPPGARVEVDGRPRGTSPVEIRDLTAAEHSVMAATRTASATRTVRVDAGGQHELIISLKESAPAAAAPAGPVGGWLVVSSPVPLDVVENGDVVGTSAVAKIMLPSGRHHIALRNQLLGYETNRQVEVNAGQVTTITITPPMTAMSANARPWAEVLVDGASVGETPLANIPVPIGAHQITFRHPQLGERQVTLTVTAKGPNRATVDLTR